MKFLKLIIDFFKSLGSPKKEVKKTVENTKVNLVKNKKPFPKEESNLLCFKNDSERLKREYNTLKTKNAELYNLIEELQAYVAEEYGKDLIITMIYRTQAEQDSIYEGNKRGRRKYSENPWKSPHQFWTAVDIRSRNYDKKEIKKLVKFLNKKYDNTNYYKWTAKCHEVKDLGEHFHIQYVKSG